MIKLIMCDCILENRPLTHISEIVIEILNATCFFCGPIQSHEISCINSIIVVYRIAQNVGGRKHWRIWRTVIDSPKFSHPSIFSTLKCNGKLTQFAYLPNARVE